MARSQLPPGVKELQPWIDRLLAGPQHPAQKFTTSGRRYADLYQTAAYLRGVLQDTEMDPRPVCLGSDDKIMVAAAMLAGLAPGAPLVLPHALSKTVLADMQIQTGYQRAIVDHPRELPGDVEQIIADIPAGDSHWVAGQLPRDPDAAYAWLFTGGSTGRPQIWSKTVNNLVGEALNLAHTFNVTADDRILATVPPNHIYGLLFSVLLALVSGAQLIEETPIFPQEIISTIRDQRATILVSVPVHYLALQDYPLSANRPRLAFSSGGMLDTDAGNAFTRNTGVPVVEVYGSTETGGLATRCRARGETAFTPFPVVDWKIEDGYLGVNSSFLSVELVRDGEGYFITGDRVRADAKGNFALLGRGDGIIKVGGKRVDLDQVRETLAQHPGVREVVVLPVKAGKGHETGIAALVAGDTTVAALKMRLQSQLEPHARPRWIRIVAQIPLTPAGKQDRAAIQRLLV